MIERNLAPVLRRLAGYYPVVTVTGPRQSGKTTLCRASFPELSYVSLEALDVRERVRADPRGFLEEHRGGAILDEVQHVPELLSYLQGEVDERPAPGRFVLTGSQHLGLSQAVSQSLAGRTAVLHLLPLSLDEVRRFPDAPRDLLTTLWTGGYPRIHDVGIPAGRWLADYFRTYVERDVRQVLQVGDLEAFGTFVRMAAGRTAGVLSLAGLGADVGISHNTARSWLSVLETSFLALRLRAWHRDIRRQLVKSPKLHLLDSGLLCYLLGIRSPEELRHHPLRGAIFESWVVSEVYKAHANRGVEPRLYHLRDRRGTEVDLVVEQGGEVTLVETKSGATVSNSFLGVLHTLGELLEERDLLTTSVRKRLIFGGQGARVQSGVEVVPWDRLPKVAWGAGES